MIYDYKINFINISLKIDCHYLIPDIYSNYKQNTHTFWYII